MYLDHCMDLLTAVSKLWMLMQRVATRGAGMV